MNAALRIVATSESPYSMDFIPLDDEDAILIYVTSYSSSVIRALMNKAVDTARRVIAVKSKSRGWTSRLKVKGQIEMYKDPL
jgi:hypothetical protein